MQLLADVGNYFLLMRQVFKKPEKKHIYYRQVLFEMEQLGINSLVIVIIISVFMGAVVTLQTANNVDNPLIPLYTIGYATRQSVVLEFSPTIISLILAGKIGSRIASEIGTMRVTEQIDALEIMGINPASYLIMPKIVASMIMNPILITLSMFLAISGGWLAGTLTGLVPSFEFIYGVQAFFHPFDIWYAIVKTGVFAFIIASVSGYCGYITKGGALEVGEASTKGVVNSSIAIIFFNLILTKLLLT